MTTYFRLHNDLSDVPVFEVDVPQLATDLFAINIGTILGCFGLAVAGGVVFPKKIIPVSEPLPKRTFEQERLFEQRRKNRIFFILIGTTILLSVIGEITYQHYHTPPAFDPDAFLRDNPSPSLTPIQLNP